MTDQDKIDDLHERVTAWRERATETGIDQDYDALIADDEFQGLIQELMEQDMDTMMILLERAVMEGSATMPDWIMEGMADEIEELCSDEGSRD